MKKYSSSDADLKEFPLHTIECVSVFYVQITVFRMGEGAQDIDLAILTALLKGMLCLKYIQNIVLNCLLYFSMFYA